MAEAKAGIFHWDLPVFLVRKSVPHESYIQVEILHVIQYNIGMEKKKPHYALSVVKNLIRQGCFRTTRTALLSAARDFGYRDASQLAQVLLELEMRDFYKSMTTLHDSTLWQDVYRHTVEDVPAYIKLQVVNETTVIISFKQLEDS